MLIQIRGAFFRFQVDDLVEQRFDGLGAWREHFAVTLPLAESLHQPGTEISPLPVQGAFGQPQDGGGLIHGQAGEIAQEYDLGLERVGGLKFLECLVDREHVIGGRLEPGACIVKFLTLASAALSWAGLAPRLFDENVVHGSSGGKKEMPSTFPGQTAAGGDPQIGFMNQRGGLERLARSLPRHASTREMMELGVNQG